jgi:hypothetical protein
MQAIALRIRMNSAARNANTFQTCFWARRRIHSLTICTASITVLFIQLHSVACCMLQTANPTSRQAEKMRQPLAASQMTASTSFSLFSSSDREF